MPRNNNEGEVIARVDLKTGKHLTTNDLPAQERDDVTKEERQSGNIKVVLHGKLKLGKVTTKDLPKTTPTNKDLIELQVEQAEERRNQAMKAASKTLKNKSEKEFRKELIDKIVKETLTEVGGQLYDEIEKRIKKELKGK